MSYKKIDSRFIKDINSNVSVYLHNKTKARIMTIENDDNNKVFSIAFRTPAQNDCGLTHILEHSVLCGSKKYPLHDPFVELLKGSLNTFLNAFTFPDKTMYPCASMNYKDFRNLMSVYLDAVFNPNIYTNPYIFKQEGWHYELESPDDEIKINGVVYNEMKGAYSDPLGVLGRYIMHSLFKNNTYQYESGGDPKYIPDLSYEEFKKFHSMYYSPSNSYILLYGNLNMEEEMKFIEDEYLNNFEYNSFDTSISLDDFNEFRREDYFYNSQTEKEDESYISYNILLDDFKCFKDNLAIDIILDVLFNVPGAPIKERLLKEGIAKDIAATIDTDVRQPYISFVGINALYKNAEKLKEIIDEEFKNVILDKDTILAQIKYREFKTREAKHSGYPKGLLYEMVALQSWLYDEMMPFEALENLKYYDELKNDINTSYFNDLINRLIISNNRKSIVTLNPKIGLLDSDEKELKDRLNKYKEALSKEEIDNLVLETKALKEYQQTPDTKEVIDTLPHLSLKDLSDEPEKFNIEKITGYPFKAFYSDYFTNNICYVDYLFDIRDFDIEKIMYAKLLGQAIALFDTSSHSEFELDKLIKTHTGGIFTPLRVINRMGDDYSIYFDIKISALSEELDFANKISQEMMYDTVFKNKDRFKDVLNKFKASIEQSISGQGHVVAATRCASYASKCYYLSDMLSGIGYLDFITDLVNNFNDKYKDILNIFDELINTIFTKERFVLDYTIESDKKDYVLNLANDFYNNLKSNTKRFESNIELCHLNEGIETSYDANYMARYGKLSTTFNGQLYVLRNAISLDYLWQNVRVLGGAYGSMIRITDDSELLLASYRDPNSNKTNDIFEKIPEFIESLKPSRDDLLKYKIGAIGMLDQDLHPSTKGQVAFSKLVSGKTYEFEKQRRIELLNTTQNDLSKYSIAFRDALMQNYICSLVSKKGMEESKKLYNTRRKLFKNE